VDAGKEERRVRGICWRRKGRKGWQGAWRDWKVRKDGLHGGVCELLKRKGWQGACRGRKGKKGEHVHVEAGKEVKKDSLHVEVVMEEKEDSLACGGRCIWRKVLLSKLNFLSEFLFFVRFFVGIGRGFLGGRGRPWVENSAEYKRGGGAFLSSSTRIFPGICWET
jgi:hypothetical protein